MDLETVFVLLCVALAVLFMARKFYRTLRGKPSCSCDTDHECASHGRGCTGGAQCNCQLSHNQKK